jgi:hypothetical protein
VVEFILDLSGYDPEANLVDAVAVEPCCGDGEFLEPMVRRLSRSCERQGRPLSDCAGSIVAVDLDPEAVERSRARVEGVLAEQGWGADESRELAVGWVRQADFLLSPDLDVLTLGGGLVPEGADFVIGNPPYVRLEAIDKAVAETYREKFRTMTGRADLYIAFYERALSLLKPGGVCGFICADRWMLNQYGGSLRSLITGGYSVEAVVEMHRADAFHDEVLAYPAVTVIRRERQGQALVAKLDGSEEGESAIAEMVDTVKEISTRQSPPVKENPIPDARSVVVGEWFSGSVPWPCVSPERLALLKHLEDEFPPLETPSTGTRVGIGVATGADKIFLTRDPDLVERDRLLPMAIGKDTVEGELDWSGTYLVNPWESDSSLVELEEYPRLREYFEEYRGALEARNVGRRNPTRWYRTIDKVNHALLDKPKLLIPDIKGEAHPVLEEGGFYPHHNLYYVVSQEWDLRVLGGLLLSRVGQLFVECYSVRMNGGYLRFQAQYLRRIRVPDPSEISPSTAKSLARSFENRDAEAATEAALGAYGIDRVPV